MDLNEFLQDIQYRGVSFGSRFLTTFTAPPKLLESISKGNKEMDKNLKFLTLRCDSSELPGAQYATSENKVMGPIYKMPNQVVYNDLTLSFILSHDLIEKYYFDYWMHLIMDNNNLFDYYSEFVSSDLRTIVYNSFGQEVYGAKFYNSYPTAVNQVTLNWQDTELIRLQVTFAYERWDPIIYEVSSNSVYPDMIADSELGLNSLRNVLSSVLPNIPGAGKIVGNPITQNLLNGRGLSISDIQKQGFALATRKLDVKDPISRALISSSTQSLSSLLRGGK
jgi:hypothetical protein